MNSIFGQQCFLNLLLPFLSKEQPSAKRVFKDYLYPEEPSDKPIKLGKLLVAPNN